MAANRNDLLGELARDAALERSDFLVRATEQLQRFLSENAARVKELGGMTLIDDDPDFLSIAPDLTFRSRARYQDDVSGEWVSETEVIESAGELVELYNPADIFSSFAEAAREAAGLPAEPTAADGLLETAGISPEETVSLDSTYAEAADRWAASRGEEGEGEAEEEGAPDSDVAAAHRLYDLALTYQERSQLSEARLIEQFESSAGLLADKLGELIVIDDDDERLTLQPDGHLVAEVVPEGAEGEWRRLTTPEELVEFYDPTDVFGDIADAVAEAYPEVAPEMDDAEEEPADR
jgi:hypothetical protein